MSLIQVKNLTFTYDGSYEPVFENASFQIDTGWRLGLIGRNGRGKTTLLRDLAFSLSDLPLSLHTVVIDTKCEFRASDYPDRCNITILRGYPFSKGMDIAIKSMSCDTVICDEIPIFEAADETINAAFCGVNIYASIHSSDRGFIKKSYYNRIYELGVFSEYYSVQREFKKSLVI